MKRVTGRLRYNPQCGRYGLWADDQWENDGFHCGEAMEAYVDGNWILTRMEMDDRDWYLVGTPYHGNLENVPVRAICCS